MKLGPVFKKLRTPQQTHDFTKKYYFIPDFLDLYRKTINTTVIYKKYEDIKVHVKIKVPQ